MSWQFTCKRVGWENVDWCISVLDLINEMDDIELVSQVEEDDDDHYFYFDGSTRGICIEPNKANAVVNLLPLANQKDWLILGEIFKAWLKDGVTISSKQDKIFIDAKFIKKNWQTYILDHQHKDVISTRKRFIDSDPTFSISIMYCFLTFKTAEIPENPTPEEALAYLAKVTEKCNLWNSAFPGIEYTKTLLNNKKLAIWSLNKAIIDNKVSYVYLNSFTEAKLGYLKIETLLEFLGDLVETSVDAILLPNLCQDIHLPLREKILAHTVEELSSLK